MKSSTPRFSVIMANYNHAEFIHQSVGSVIWQTFKDWELIFVDDASEDNSVKTFEKYSNNRMTLVDLDKNVGVGRAKGIAASKAKGEILVVLDSDDALARTALEDINVMYERYPELVCVYSQHVVCDTNLIPIHYGRCGVIPPNKTYLDLLCGPMSKRVLMSHAKSFRKSAYDKTLGYCNLKKSVDKDIMLKIEEVGKCMFLNKVLYFYRCNPNGVSLGSDKNISERTTSQVITQAKLRRGLL